MSISSSKNGEIRGGLAYHRQNLLRGILCLITGLVLIGALSQAGMQIALKFDMSMRGDNYRQWFERTDRGQVEFVTLGSSHSLAIDIETLPGPSNHLFLPVADIHEVRTVARTLLHDATNLKMVLVPVAPIFPYQDNATHYPPSRLANYGTIATHSAALIDGDLKGWFAARHEGLRAWARIPGWVGCWAFNSSSCLPKQDLGHAGVFPPEFAELKASQFLNFIGPDYPAPMRAAHQIDALRVMAVDFSARGVTLVLYPSPLSKVLLDALDRGYEERGWIGQEYLAPDINAVRKMILAGTPPDLCLHWINGIWSVKDAQTPEYYRPNDVDHLSPEGARVFTSRLVEKITKLGDCAKPSR